MMLHNANDLISAGIGFSIVDTDADFDDSGELSGYTTIIDDMYAAPSDKAEENAQLIGFFEADEAGSAIEDFALLDDGGAQVEHQHRPCTAECEEGCKCSDKALAAGPARWEHIRDSHMAETLELAKLERPAVGDTNMDYGAMQYASLGRERRVHELRGWCVRLRIMLRAARRRNNRVAINHCLSMASAFRKGINDRYRQSVALVVNRGKAAELPSERWEWHLLYLTSAQRAHLLDCVAYAIK